MRAAALLALALLVLAGCLDEDGGRPAAHALEMRTLEKGSFSPIGEDLHRVIRDGEEWDAVWSFHNASGWGPEVDFAREMVVAVVVHGPTGCGQMHIGSVVHDAAAREVVTTIVLEVPPEEVQCFAAFEDVYHFVAVPARDGAARFVTVEEPQPGAPTPTTPPAAQGSFAFRTLDRGSASGIDDARREVLADVDAWRALWIEHTSIMDPPPPMPEVDWERERVLAVTAGARGNTCWSVSVDAIEIGEDNVTARVTTVRPPPGAACGMAITHPYHFVTYPITKMPLVVVEREG